MILFLIGALLAFGVLAVVFGLRRQTVTYGRPARQGINRSNLMSGLAESSQMSEPDLKVLGLDPEVRTVSNLKNAVLTACVLVCIAVLLFAVGVRISPVLYLLIIVVASGAAYLWSQFTLADEARERRDEYGRLLLTYTSLVSMLLTGAGGVESSMRRVAAMFDDDLFDEIVGAMDEGSRTEGTPWKNLARFAQAREIKLLAELAGALDQAAVGGAALETSLVNKVEDGRELTLIDAQAAGEVANEKMTAPMTALSFGCMLFIAIPMILQMLGDF